MLGWLALAALIWGVLWSIGALTRHLRAVRLGPSPYWWQERKPPSPNPAHPKRGFLRPFWSDLKASATKPYGRKTTLEKAYGACVLLFAVAILPMPYAYYLGMRVGVCIALYFFAIAAFRTRRKHAGWFVGMLVLLALYNPVVPVHLGVQLLWTAINAVTIYVLYRARAVLDMQPERPAKTIA
ncbi:MAG: hypothetical protein JWQ89_3512 [Devosia sp.]|uniref:DUF6804 family protein n=1 Tax=Devosia sp. TaxID=1871048 RepID=UPI00261A881B|nr:DUF6804 family protein [Devosia sp.]MDB5541785.1 hypothetical protein [Devosia sp.]